MIQLLPKSLNTAAEKFQYYATFHVPLNIFGGFCPSSHIFALDTFLTLYSNWYKKEFHRPNTS